VAAAVVAAFLVVTLASLVVPSAAAGSSTTRTADGPELPKGWELPSDVAKKRIVALIDSECPDIDYDLERRCSDLRENSAIKKCVTLPFAVQPRLQDRKHAMQRTTYMAMFRRFAPAFVKMGFTFEAARQEDFLRSHNDMASAQVLIVADYSVAELVFRPELGHVRFIILQTANSATVPWLECDFGDDRILAYFQHTSLYPLTENNGPLISNERLNAWLDPMNSSIAMREPLLKPEELNKVYTVLPYVYRYKYPLDCGGRKWYLQIKEAFEKARDEWLSDLEDRKWDVVVVAPPNPTYPQAIQEHRLMGLEMVEYLEQRHQLKVKVWVRPPTTREFHEATKNAKIMVSTFGLGEAVGKDYESILSGAVLVKPYSLRLQSFPDIYTSGYSVSCRADFADLEQVVMTVLGHLRRAQALVDTAYSKLVKEAQDEQVILKIGTAMKAALSSEAAQRKLTGKFCKPSVALEQGSPAEQSDL